MEKVSSSLYSRNTLPRIGLRNHKDPRYLFRVDSWTDINVEAEFSLSIPANTLDEAKMKYKAFCESLHKHKINLHMQNSRTGYPTSEMFADIRLFINPSWVLAISCPYCSEEVLRVLSDSCIVECASCEKQFVANIEEEDDCSICKIRSDCLLVPSILQVKEVRRDAG